MESLQEKRKVAIIIGHCIGEQGASSKHGIPDEWAYNTYTCLSTPKRETFDVDFYFYNDFNNGYVNTVIEKAKTVNTIDYSLVIELHYNSYYNENARGTECLYYKGSKLGIEFAEIYCDTICNNFGTKKRGAKPLSSNKDRGFASVYYYTAPAVICEPFFGTSALDCIHFKDKYEKYGNSIYDAIELFLLKIDDTKS